MTSPLDLIARLRHDVRALALPPPARLALYHLASEGGAIHTADLTTTQAFELLERGAGESVGRALDLGVIEHLHAVLRLVFTAPDGGVGGDIGRSDPSSHLPGPAAPRAAAKTASAPAPKAANGARSTSPADALRNARWYFKRRSRAPWKDVPADVTFEAWLASPEGVAWRAARGLDAPTAATVAELPEGVASVAVAPLQTVAATPATATAATVEGVADRCETVAATALQTVAEVRNGVAATVGNGVAEVRNAVAGPPSPTPSPSEKTEKKDQTNQTSDAREGGGGGVHDLSATAGNGVAATVGNGNASQRHTVAATATATATATPRNGNAPISATELDALIRKHLGNRVRPLRLMEIEAFDHLMEFVSERWSEANREPVTAAHWHAFVAWLDKGGDDGMGGLSWWKQGKPPMSWLMRETNLADKFDEAMSWWPSRRKHLEGVKRRAEAAERRTSEPPAAPASPVLSPTELAAKARAAAEMFRAANSARKPAPLTYRGHTG